MKTVGYFKELGLELVEGDVVDYSEANDGSDMRPLTSIMADRCNEGAYDFDLAPIESFAWRENTGEKPSFNGLIDYVLKGEVYNGNASIYTHHTDVIDWREHCRSHQVVKWRPSLNQSTIQTEATEEKEEFEAMTEHKPVFTQAMADAGELPPVGSTVLLEEDTGFYSDHRGEVFTSKAGEPVDVIGYATRPDTNASLLTLFNGSGFVSICPNWIRPIKSDREKAIDEIFNVCYPSKKPSELLSTALGKIYDANYRKLTPSQTKDYDDKAGYFSEGGE